MDNRLILINMDTNETVTLSIQSYEKMKAEIAYLKEQVKQKTIIKEVQPTWWEITTLIAVAAVGVTALIVAAP